jgi:hypothetical protein
MIRILLFVKHRLGFIWRIIEYLNGVLFGLLFAKRFGTVLENELKNACTDQYQYRVLLPTDAGALQVFLTKQPEEQTRFFKPHAFDKGTLLRLLHNPSFIMMGIFAGEQIVGYFFLRCFVNKKCFIGRIVDAGYQRQGLAKSMSNIMYRTAWASGFQCLTTISKNNRAIFDLHQKEKNIQVLKELPDHYLLVEMLPNQPNF